MRAYKERYPERVAAQHKAWHEKDPAARRAHRLLTVYGLTLDDFNAMLAAQDGRCAICKTTEPGGKGGVFQVDHCHDSMKVRGLLCDACNRGIGMLRHDVSVLAGAIAYLSRSSR